MPWTENILVRGVNWLGDAVMATPALQRLREAKPQAQITLLTHEKLSELWHGHPSIDRVITFDSGESVFTVGRRLRGERFDVAVVFPNSFRSALEVFLVRIPQRIGYARNGRSVLLTRAVPPRAGAVKMHKRSRAEIEERITRNAPRETFPASAHHAHDYLQLVAPLGASTELVPPLLRVSDSEVSAACARFGLNDDLPLFAQNPGAEYGAAKRWPPERFVETAVRLQEGAHGRWIILGGPADRELAGGIASEFSKRTNAVITNLAGKTSLRELCAVLKACALLISNDTGPMHIAAALGTPVIVPFGSTAPELTGPLSVSELRHPIAVGNVPCAPCFLRECPIDFRCMNSIAVEQVASAARWVWTERARK